MHMLSTPNPATAVSTLLNASVVAALVTGILTAAGWLVSKRAQAKRDQAEFRRAHIQKQIEEFYGPVYSLVWQLFAINELKEEMLSNQNLNQATRARIDDYLATKYFLPMHGQVRNILETKLYLVEGTNMPDSVFAYLKSAMQETVQRELWSSSGIDTSFVEGIPWPPQFYDDIEGPLKKLMAEYEADVQLLRGEGAAGQ
jgi:hypothetical protein